MTNKTSQTYKLRSLLAFRIPCLLPAHPGTTPVTIISGIACLYFFTSFKKNLLFIEERSKLTMPVLESTGEITPKSVLRHRPIAEDAGPHGKKPAITPVSPVVQRASRNRPKETEGDEEVKVSEWHRVDDDTKNTR